MISKKGIEERGRKKNKIMEYVPIGKENALRPAQLGETIGWFSKAYISGLLGEIWKEGQISRMEAITLTDKGHATGYAYYIPNAGEKEAHKIMDIFAKSGHQLTPKALNLLRKKLSTINVEELIEDINSEIFVVTEETIQNYLQERDITEEKEAQPNLPNLDKVLRIWKRAKDLNSKIKEIHIANSFLPLNEHDKIKGLLCHIVYQERDELIKTRLSTKIIHYLDGKEGEL